jgi:hypothetical protein
MRGQPAEQPRDRRVRAGSMPALQRKEGSLRCAQRRRASFRVPRREERRRVTDSQNLHKRKIGE